MITTGYVRTMAEYNAEMNRRIYAGAARLSDEERRRDQGAFFKSLHGTLTHILWADRMWMSRFDHWEKPDVVVRDSPTMVQSFDDLVAERTDADRRISDWAGRVSQNWLDSDLVWFSGIAQTELRRNSGALTMHFFNHQTNHRGQAHALLTRGGIDPGATDIWAVVA